MGSEGHCFHHSVNIGCYGVTRLWDRVFGTDANYVEWLQKQKTEEKPRMQ
jgi:sterol desaturase/sphingolipid hydroxylase (fatty acid hydroxylase superfamily)